MAYRADNNDMGWVTFSDGTEANIHVEDVRAYISDANNHVGREILEADVIETTPLGGGLARLDVHLEAIGKGGAFEFAEGATIPLAIGDPEDGLRADVPYFVLLPPENTAAENMAAPLMACDLEALRTSRAKAWAVEPVKLVRDTEDGGEEEPTADSVYVTELLEDGTTIEHTFSEAGMDPQSLYTFREAETGEQVTFGELLHGLFVLQASFGVAVQMRERREGKKKEELPPLTKVKTRTHFWPIDKASRHITDPDVFEDGGQFLNVGRKSGQTVISLAMERNGGQVTTSRPLDTVDREIVSAVATLREAARRGEGKPVISAYGICQAMGISKPSEEKVADIDARMSELMHVKATIEFSEEAQRRKLTNPATGRPFVEARITRNIVEAEAFEGLDDEGNRYIRYRLISDPPTYEHAKMIKQVATWPQRVMELAPVRADGTTYRRHSTDRQRAIKAAILERVYSKGKISTTILYGTLCESVGVNQRNRDAKKTVVDFTESYLRALKIDGKIADFRPHTEGSAHQKTGVDVFVKGK